MKKEVSEVRNIVLRVRLNQSEKETLQKLQKQSTEKTLSNYIRKVSLQKPVTVRYRNQSTDDLLNLLLELRKDLNGIANNFNQAVKKLHTLDKIPEFRQWIQNTEHLQQSVSCKVEEVKLLMNQTYQQWSPK